MKHCPRCLQEYEDWVRLCADCSCSLNDGPPGAQPSGHAASLRQPAPRPARPPGSECVYSGPPEFSEPLALALADAGIPAFTGEAELETDDDPEADRTEDAFAQEGFVDVLVPRERYAIALWFVKGFEAAGGLGSDEDGGEVQEPGEPD